MKKIVKEEEKIIRPGNVWTPYVQLFLAFMHESGFRHIPKPYGINESGEEVVSFVDGTVYDRSLPKEILTDEILTEAANLLRRYHDAGEAYLSRLTKEEIWMLPERLPAEVMCHGDFAPYNITFADGHVHGIIDFDTLHPGPRVWDVAYAVYRWIPFVSPDNPDYFYGLDDQIRRLRLFADTYDLKKEDREKLPDMMTERLDSLVAYMRTEAEDGNEDVRENIDDGHLKLYLDDISYIKEAKKNILEGIL